MDFAERERMQWEALVGFLVQGYYSRISRPRTARPLLPPFERSSVSQTVHVVCLGWHKERELMQYVYEFNTFWQNMWRYDEAERAAADLAVEVGPEAELRLLAQREMDAERVAERIRMSWAQPNEVEIEHKEQ